MSGDKKFDNEEVRHLAEKISEEFKAIICEYEQKAEKEEVFIDKEILELSRNMDTEMRKQKQYQRILSLSRIAAVFVVGIILMGSLTLSSSEAFRVKLFDLFFDSQSGSIILRTEEERELLKDWDDYWYPTYMAEGFSLTGAEETEIDKIMLYTANLNGELRIFQYSSQDAIMEHDIDSNLVEEISVGYYAGYFFEDEINNQKTLIWQTENEIIEIVTIGYNDTAELLKIAENMKYQK